jgi:hypothetical protein
MSSEAPAAQLAPAPMAPFAMSAPAAPASYPVRSRGGFPVKSIALVAIVFLVVVFLGYTAYALLGGGSPGGMTYMPDNCRVIVSIRVADIYNSGAWAEVKKEFPQIEKEVEKAIKEGELGPADITQVLFGFSDITKQEWVATMETKKNPDISKLHSKGIGTKPTETKVGSYTVLSDGNMAACKINSSLVVMGHPDAVKAVLLRDKKPVLPEGLQKALKDADFSQAISIAVDIKSFANDPMLGQVATQGKVDMKAVESAVVNISVSSDIKVSAITVCKDAKTAVSYRKMADGGVEAMKNLGGGQMPPEVMEILEGIKIQDKDNRLTADVTIKVGPILKAAKPFIDMAIGMQAQQQFNEVGREIRAKPKMAND